MNYSINKQALMDKLGFDEEDLVMLFSVFIKSSNENIDKLREAIQTKDYNTIYICSHSLKGSSGNMMLNEVYTLSREIESASKDSKDIDYMPYCNKIADVFNNLKLI